MEDSQTKGEVLVNASSDSIDWGVMPLDFDEMDSDQKVTKGSFRGEMIGSPNMEMDFPSEVGLKFLGVKENLNKMIDLDTRMSCHMSSGKGRMYLQCNFLYCLRQAHFGKRPCGKQEGVHCCQMEGATLSGMDSGILHLETWVLSHLQWEK